MGGCVPSRPTGHRKANAGEATRPFQPPAVTPKAGTTRARRLSLEARGGQGQIPAGMLMVRAVDGPDPPEAAEEAAAAGAGGGDGDGDGDGDGAGAGGGGGGGAPPGAGASTGAVAAATAGAAGGGGGGSGGDGKPSSPTRGRRLSYVTNDKQVADKIRAEYSMQFSEDELGSTELIAAVQAREQEQAAAAAGSASPGAGAGAQRCKAQQQLRQLRQLQARREVEVQVACVCRAGREPGYRKTNQDNCFAFERYITSEGAVFGTLDGHGPFGHLVSGFVKQHLPIMLVGHLTGGAGAPEALEAVFAEADAAVAASGVDCEFSGSTCSVAHLEGRTLTTAWVGDSRVVLGRQGKRGTWEALDLSHDHKPTLPEERARVLRSHGRVERLVDEGGAPVGPYRVWLDHAWVPGLAMSRALGDHVAHTVGVSSQPEVRQVQLTPADRLLVLASDGVWEFISSQEAVEMLGACETAEDGARLLVDEAYRRWLNEEDGVVDDITAVVVRLLHEAPAGGREAQRSGGGGRACG